MTFAREPLQVVEILQPLCSRTFGEGACPATGRHCWGTDATCRAVTALDLSATIPLRFVLPAAWRTPATGFDPGSAIPALSAVDTAPTVLNVGAGNDDLSPLGLRAVATVAIRDFPHNDVGLDPYVDQRDYDPETRGSFWSKWLVRNPYHLGFRVRIYDGYLGDDLADMICREYFIDRIDASRSSVRIIAKDILRKVTDTDVSAPALSPGALALDITAEATGFEVAGATLADYPEAGWVRIGSEVLAYAARAEAGGNIAFTGVTRAALATAAATHARNDRVQRVLAYEDQPFTDILFDLLVNWGKIPAGYIDKAAWDAEFLEWRELYRFTAWLTEPVKVQKLVGEICQQALSNIWWDERVQRIVLRAQRPNFRPGQITQEGHILADSVTITEVPADRASDVRVYYALRSPVLSVSETLNFAQGAVVLDVDKERQYGEAKVKEIAARWVRSGVIAQALATAYLRRFRDVRRRISFDLAAKDIGSFWTGDVAQISHFLSIDASGAPLPGNWLITSAETVEQGGRYRFEAEDNETAGIMWELVADDDARPVEETGCWLDAEGTDGAGNMIDIGWL